MVLSSSPPFSVCERFRVGFGCRGSGVRADTRRATEGDFVSVSELLRRQRKTHSRQQSRRVVQGWVSVLFCSGCFLPFYFASFLSFLFFSLSNPWPPAELSLSLVFSFAFFSCFILCSFLLLLSLFFSSRSYTFAFLFCYRWGGINERQWASPPLSVQVAGPGR